MFEKYESLGVVFKDKKSVFIDENVKIGKGTLIYPNVELRGNTVIGENNIIESYTIIEDSIIKDASSIGPFAHIHKDCHIASSVVIGNYVEVKHSKIGRNTKIKHLSYVGDALIGDFCNIGAGVVFANYKKQGAKKESTRVGDHAFIGSHAVLIAPLEIGENAFVAASSTITENVPSNSLAIARNRQTTKEGYLEEKKA